MMMFPRGALFLQETQAFAGLKQTGQCIAIVDVPPVRLRECEKTFSDSKTPDKAESPLLRHAA